MRHDDFLNSIDSKRITDAIANAEAMTSGEIRVHVQPKSRGELRSVAERTFERLGMTKTALRNGVLLFIASEENSFVILGDTAIHENVPAGFWDEIAAKLTIRFKDGEFTDGIVEAVEAAGAQLRDLFPRSDEDVDELPNEISTD